MFLSSTLKELGNYKKDKGTPFVPPQKRRLFLIPHYVKPGLAG